ncbi:MAG: Crp/Fnr family transcriptional regulator [Rhodoblastus sp.]|nr:Crp/Fnr family transcriptional regulator [Rhodoblastus sp.]
MTELSKSSQRELARAALARAPAFSQCASATLDRFVAEGTLRIFKRGETVSHRGGPVSNLCVLATGSVEVSATSATGKRHVLHYLESGQLFNVIGAFDGGPGIHDAIAHEETLALLIPRATLLAAVEVEPLLAMAMVRFLCLRSRALYDYIAEHTLLPLRARCARLLLSLVELYGASRPHGYLITLKLSQEEFADMLGRSRQSVNKELRTLESEGLIKTNYSQFIIVDLPTLQAVAEGR